MRWLSLHSVVGMLEYNLGLEGLHDGIGFSIDKLKEFNK